MHERHNVPTTYLVFSEKRSNIWEAKCRLVAPTNAEEIQKRIHLLLKPKPSFPGATIFAVSRCFRYRRFVKCPGRRKLDGIMNELYIALAAYRAYEFVISWDYYLDNICWHLTTPDCITRQYIVCIRKKFVVMLLKNSPHVKWHKTKATLCANKCLFITYN